VNSYRIQAFRIAIEQNLYPQFTIIAVAFECGFRSSSTFYALFRRQTGMTPRQFVDNISQ
ncbi:MAG: AraC family transcriptional regulator, partial [Spirochaetales bacterium]|nr:AraC family transcriptional regulator [Spirochaetales bacterium]